MDIVKSFTAHGVLHNVNIRGTADTPLFQANQVGSLLGLTNISKALDDFDSSEKVITSSYTLGGHQDILFVTELGLYRLLFRSRKPIARSFQKWVAQVIQEIRMRG